MKLLVLGASGLTGYKVMHLAKERFETYGTYNSRAVKESSLIKMDLMKQADLEKVMSDIKPDVVVNTTAFHNVDYCESHPKQAYYVNAEVVRILTEICNKTGIRLIHISTDFVFDGKKSGSYSEDDKPNPESIYAKSKLEGERNAAECSSYCILRTSVVYGWTPVETLGSISSSGKPMNFALWVLSKLSKGEELKIVNDQFTSPTLADVLAEVIIKLAGLGKNGLYHVSGTSCLSRYEFARKIADTMGYSQDLVKPVDSKSFAQVAKRPANSCLNCEKIQRELNCRLLSVDESLALMRSQIEIESPSLLG
jgi:dTDP-4-dehydrorhamnose reductase